MIPTTVSSSPSTATISGTTGNNHNNGSLNSFSTVTPTTSAVFASATSPQTTQTSSIMLGLAALILEGRAVADDEFQPHTTRTTAVTNDANSFSGSGSGTGQGTSSSSNSGGVGGSSLHNYNTNSLLASTSYGILSGSGSGSAAVGGGRQSPTCRPSTSRAAASFCSSSASGSDGLTTRGHVINITTNPYAFNNNNNNSASGAYASRGDPRPLYIDPYTHSNSDSASSSAESTHQRWTQKLCQLRQVSPAASLSTAYEQPVTVEAREPELVALAINESGASERGEFEIVRRTLLNRANLNAMSGGATASSAGAGSAGSPPSSGSGSDNFLLSLQSLATTCLRSGSPSLEPSGSASTTSTPNAYRYAALSSPPSQHSMYIYRANTPTPTAQNRFHDQHGSASSCGSGVQSPRPHWSAAAAEHSSILHAREKYMRHVANSGLSLGTGRLPIPGTAVNATIGGTTIAAAAATTTNIGNTTKIATASATAAATPLSSMSSSSKYPQQGPHCDQFLKKMGLAKGEAAEAEDHVCDSSNLNLSCSRWRAYCNRIESIMARGEPVCIEVYLGPMNHKILLEQWIITQKGKVPPPTMTLPSLCSAIRSQLYFSQISAWCDLIKKSDQTIYDTGRIIFSAPTGAAGDLATPIGSAAVGGGGSSNSGTSTPSAGVSVGVIGNTNHNINITPGTSPNSHTLNQLNNLMLVNERPRLNIYYRIKSFDSTACFNSKPNVHNFPNVNISENCSISVCLKSLPRINGGIPKIGTLMLSNPGAAAISITTTTTITTMSATTSSKTKRNDTTKTITTTIAALTTMPSSSTSLSSSTMAASSMQLLTAANGSTYNSNTNKFRNGNSQQSFTPSTETPRSSRINRCGDAAPLTATSFISEAPSTSTASLATTSSAAKSRVFIKSPSIGDTPLAKSASTTSASSKSSASSSATNSSTHNNAPSFSNGKSDTSASDLANSSSDSNESHIGATSSPATSKHKCSFFIGEDELHAVDEADGDIEAYCDDDDNRSSDTANSTADSMTSTSALSASGHMSHREKQLMKYRKRMLKRDKKHQHQHQQQPKPLTTTSDASNELGSTSTELASKQQEQQRTLNGCQPMEEGDEEDACATLVTSHSSAQIEMISTGTQTPMSCCRQCGCEKTLICLRCTAGGSAGSSEQRREQAIENPTEQKGVAADDMDDSTASSLSSSEIISTPRNKAELLLQAIQRTPKVAAAKHKNEQPRHPCGSGGAKAHNNNQMKSGQAANGADDFTTGSGCQVCKRQKTQHNFGNSNGALELNATNGEQLTDKAADDGDDDDNIGDDTDEEDDDDDGGRSHIYDTINATTDANEDLTTPLTVIAPGAELMEEESFISSTKLTPQIDRCTLSTNSNNSASYQILATGERVAVDQAIDACSLPGNRTPPIITTYMEGDECCYDESQFRTPTSNATNLNRNELTPLQQQQQHAQKAMPHKLTPKPNLLQLHCNYRDEMSVGDSMHSVGASGDGFGMLSTHQSPASKPQKQQCQTGSASTLLLRSKGLPKVNLTPIFCNPMPTTMGCSGGGVINIPNSSYSLPIPIHGATNYDSTTFCFEPTMLQLSGNQMQLHHQLMHSSNGSNFCASPLVSTTTDANNIPVQKSFSAPTLPNSPSLSPRFAKQAAIYKRRSRHLSDRSDRSSLGSDEQFSDEDLESAGMYSPATSPLKQCARVAATFGRQPLLGNLEESLLQKRLMPKVEVMGFKVLLGASGGFCPTQLTIPAAAYFYELQGETLSTPYVCDIRLPRKGYSVPRAGTVQATLLNPMGTVVRMFVIPYDMRDMPPLHQTFIRQRILAEASSNEATTQNVQSNQNANAQYASGHMPAYTNGFGGGGGGGDDNLNINNNNSDCYQNNNNNNNNNVNAKNRYRLSPSGGLHGESNLGHFISAEHMKRLRYSIHLRFQTSRSGRLSLHTDIRLLISRRTEYDTAAAHAKGVLEAPNDLVTDTVMPTNPRYSARQDQSSSGGSGSSSTSTNIIVATALTANSSNNTTLTTTATTTTTTTTHNNNGSASNKI